MPDRRSRALSRLEARTAATAGAASALAQVGWGAAVVGVAVAAATGRHPAEITAILLLGAVALAEPVLTLPDAAVARRAAAGARQRLTALAELPCPAGPSTVDGTAAASTVEEDLMVTVRGLTAGWDGSRPALRGLDLELPPGRRVAVLGASGSGKSTLAAVLVRMLDPVAGSVLLGGTDLRDLPDAVLRRTVGLVGDAADHVFATTVRQNLCLARPAATDAELRAALIRAHLGPWLDTLPAGLATWLGEGGATISGGQRRRLAMARALLADPALLVLDEPTEGLAEQEAAGLMTDLLTAATGRAVLLLTHRRDGLEHVDTVYDLVAGSLIKTVPTAAVQAEAAVTARAGAPGLRRGRRRSAPGTATAG